MIGSMTDLSAASLDDVKGFFATYYAPNNACVVIAGDFDPVQVKVPGSRSTSDVYHPCVERPSSVRSPRRLTLNEDKRLVVY